MSRKGRGQPWVPLLGVLAALTACTGEAAKATGACADLGRALHDRPASELNRLGAPANTDSFQRELGVRTRSSSGAQNTHQPDDPITAVDLFAGRANKPEADLVFLAYADGTMRYVGCANVTAGPRPATLPVSDTSPSQDAVLLIDPIWIGGRPYNKPGVLDYLPISGHEPATGLFFGRRSSLLPPLLAPVVTDTGLDLQTLDGGCTTRCLDFGLLVTDLAGGKDGSLAATMRRTSVLPRPADPGGPTDVPTLPERTGRIAIVFSGSGQNFYPEQDWHVRQDSDN